MPNTVQHTWIYVSVTPDGLQWPTREDSINSSNFARIPGRWISDTEFETTDGEVMLIPPTGADDWRDGPINWRERASLQVERR